MPELNTELLLRVSDRIRRRPETYEQSVWLQDEEGCALNLVEQIEAVRNGKMTCGAQACVAGHGVLMSGMKKLPMEHGMINWFEAGKQAFGLTDSEASWLFDSERIERSMSRVLRAMARGITDRDELEKIEQRYGW